jgi:citrate lyase beta subunit
MNAISITNLLFTPGNIKNRFQKGLDSQTDCLILDLEDSVGIQDKEIARLDVFEWLSQLKSVSLPKSQTLSVRVNSIDSPYINQDTLAIIQSIKNGHAPDLIFVPKVEDPVKFSNWIDSWSKISNSSPHVIALIESSRGLKYLDEICQSHPKLLGLGFGGADLSVDLRCNFDYESLLFFRSQMVMYSALYKLALWDVPFLDIKDSEGLQLETTKVKGLGFTGKFAIHPQQISIIKKAFEPTHGELTWAREVIEMFEKNKGDVFSFNGKMIDEPLILKAKHILLKSN